MIGVGVRRVVLARGELDKLEGPKYAARRAELRRKAGEAARARDRQAAVAPRNEAEGGERGDRGRSDSVAVDAGSSFGRIWPSHRAQLDAATATRCLEAFIAQLAALLGLFSGFKPHVVRSDQGSAFTSFHFSEFLAARQILQSLACTYTPCLLYTSDAADE